MVGGDSFGVVCEWGLSGLRAAGAGRVVIVVDVFSFSTAVTVALSRGATVLPCAWDEQAARALAEAENAEVASRRKQGPYTLEPASLRAIPAGLRLVLPSRNGSAISYAARQAGATSVVAACFRNAAAVARWVNARRQPCAVIAAGERWPDDSLRVALEDWLCAGAVIRHLDGARSPEAQAAVAAFEQMRTPLPETLADTFSGQQLLGVDYNEDIDLAAELDVDQAVPLLVGNAFTLARL